jgi:hypothetical protein
MGYYKRFMRVLDFGVAILLLLNRLHFKEIIQSYFFVFGIS